MKIQPAVDPFEGHLKYEKVRNLGKGANGFVVLAKDKDNDDLVAVKFMKRGPENISKYAERELVNHSSLVHPHVIKFREVFLTDEYLAIAMDYAPGGTLYSYVHAKSISNRDIKLQNTLLDTVQAGRMPTLKICDFGYSINEKDSIAKTAVGTPGYTAPEVLTNRCKYDGKLADVWSSGVMLYFMLFHQYPFERQEDRHFNREQRNAKIDQRIINAEYVCPQHITVSDSCKDFLSKVFVVDPTKRITTAGIWRHAWIQEGLPTELKNIDDYNNHWLGLPTGQQHEDAIKEVLRQATGGNDYDFHNDDQDDI